MRSTARPLQIHPLIKKLSESVKTDQTDDGSNSCNTGESIDSRTELPIGWTINDNDEILNEEGLPIVEIEEEFEPESDQVIPLDSGEQDQRIGASIEHSEHFKHRTRSDSDWDISSRSSLPLRVSELLDQLEVEEESERSQNVDREDEPDIDDDDDDDDKEDEGLMSPQAIRDEIDKTLNLRKVDGETSKRSTEESREWGKVGLDGLKDAFNRNRVSGSMRKINGSEDVGTDDQRRNDSDQKVQFTNSQIEPPEKNEKKKLQKKTVTFAPQPSSSSSSSSSDVEKTTPRPPRGIMLPDVVERAPVQSVENVQIAQKRVPVPIEKLNGRNGHLNPRLASLLPRSYCERQIGASVNPECGAGDDDQNVEDDDDDDDDDDLSSDEKEFDADSVWSEDDEEEGDDKDSNWPPLDLDIQTALDLRQAALEYHSKRNGLGLGPGTGPLGGDRQAPEPDEESEEWVPMDTRAKAEGVPRQLNGSSRFRTGKSLVWDGKIGSNPTGERVTDGKLHGTEPLIQGPEPRAERAAVYQIPGRKSDREGVDEDLTAEEMELLRSRIEILGMDEESRIAAESAGTALMELMEKARRGEVVLESEKDKDHLSEGPVDGRSERPPELKTVTTTKKKNKLAESLSTGKVVERNDLEKQFDSKKTFGSDKIDSLECRKSEEERSEQLKKKGDEDCDIFTGVEVNRGGFKKVSRFKIDRNR